MEFAALAVLVLAFAFGAEALGSRKPDWLPRFEVDRVRAVALAGALGLWLYYPLVLLAVFNGTFHETSGGLYTIAIQAPWWIRVLAPAFGALAAGLIVRYVSPESGGHGVVEVMEAIHLRGHQLRGRIAVWKSLAAGLVIGSGGSAGREVRSSTSAVRWLPRWAASWHCRGGKRRSCSPAERERGSRPRSRHRSPEPCSPWRSCWAISASAASRRSCSPA